MIYISVRAVVVRRRVTTQGSCGALFCRATGTLKQLPPPSPALYPSLPLPPPALPSCPPAPPPACPACWPLSPAGHVIMALSGLCLLRSPSRLPGQPVLIGTNYPRGHIGLVWHLMLSGLFFPKPGLQEAGSQRSQWCFSVVPQHGGGGGGGVSR